MPRYIVSIWLDTATFAFWLVRSNLKGCRLEFDLPSRMPLFKHLDDNHQFVDLRIKG